MKKLVALFLCLILAFSMVTGAYASDTQSLLAQLRSANKGEMKLPELADTFWFASEVIADERVMVPDSIGMWYAFYFIDDGTFYFLNYSFAENEPQGAAFAWKKISDTEVELMFGEEKAALTYDGESLSIKYMLGNEWKLVQDDSEQGSRIQWELNNLSFAGTRYETEYADISGMFKPAAVFGKTDERLIYYKYDSYESDLSPTQLLYVAEQENGCYVAMIETENSFSDVTTAQQAQDMLLSVEAGENPALKLYTNHETVVQDDKSLADVTLTTATGEEILITEFYQQLKESYILRMDGLYYIYLPLN